MPIMTFNRVVTVNYLIVNTFIGGVSVASNETSVFAKESTLLQYVAQPVFTLCPFNVC